MINICEMCGKEIAVVRKRRFCSKCLHIRSYLNFKEKYDNDPEFHKHVNELRRKNMKKRYGEDLIYRGRKQWQNVVKYRNSDKALAKERREKSKARKLEACAEAYKQWLMSDGFPRVAIIGNVPVLTERF